MSTQLTLVGPAPRIAVEHAGAGPLVLFLHGVGGNRSNWRAQLQALAPEFHAAAWDARGYGDSDDYPGPMSFADCCDDAVRVLDQFGAATAHVVGLSMGGMIALELERRYPRRVASLVLCDTTHVPAEGLSAEQIEEFLRSRRAPLLAGKEPRDIAPAVAHSLVSPFATAEHVQQLVDSMAALHKESYVKALETVARWSGRPDLATVAAPTLVIVGSHDPLTPPAASLRIATGIPGARLCVIERAGHLSNIEQPAQFNTVLREFLLDLEGTPS